VRGLRARTSDRSAHFASAIWLTEFGGTGTDAEQVAFVNEVLPWMDSQDFIAGYSIEGAFNEDGHGLTMIKDDVLTVLGTAYNTA
jgi:hypothetical protein